MKAGFRKLLKVQKILSENFWKCQKNQRPKAKNNTEGEMQEHNKISYNDKTTFLAYLVYVIVNS